MRTGRTITLLKWSRVWLMLVGVYLICAVSFGVRELIAGAVSAAVTTGMVYRLARCGGLRFGVRWRDALTAWRMPGYWVTGTGEVAVALAKQLFTTEGAASQMAVAPFELGDRVDPAEAGRRALATFYTTATPNFIVLGLLDEHGAMLYHQVRPGPVLAITRALGTGPGPNG